MQKFTLRSNQWKRDKYVKKVLNGLICLHGVKPQEKDSFFEVPPNQSKIKNEGSTMSVF